VAKWAAASYTDQAIGVSSSEASISWPSPVRARACRAARMARAANIPVPMSATGIGTGRGGPSSAPVMDMSPDMPCAMRSKPPRAA
jgi:hypothetical protein